MMHERRWATVVVIAASALIGGCAVTPRQFGTGGGGADSGSAASSGAGGVVCGDGVIGGTEACDKSDLGGSTCASVKGVGYFASPGQVLACKPDCTFDTSVCTNACIFDEPGSQVDSCVLQ